MKMSHTKGPWIGIDPKTKKFRNTHWRADSATARRTLSAPITSGRTCVAMVVSDDWDKRDEFDANARLIAAAPDLLHALSIALPFVEDAEDDPCLKKGAAKKAVKLIRDALARAEA